LEEAAKLNSRNMPLRVMFQDEAWFGRLSDPRRCWAPAPLRPMVSVALAREYTYAYATITPEDGALDWMLTPKMNTINMSAFLEHVSQRLPDDFVVMILDWASSHRSLDLRVPENMTLVRLPPYSHELNPANRLWDEICEKEFANRFFDSLGSAMAQAARGLKRLEDAPEALRFLTGWDWILGSS
jgi:putative transposase